ncbi:MAG TPA: hypothetical protein ENK44_04375 [Caldithrix abyssi]|uniref:Arsenate reductase n=1 Tax=Caldithrix abyssi TaxID=187145 RepID=A0A7V4TYX0_CALAY|nr:hypothetical protein [Caldithrix abyssi]
MEQLREIAGQLGVWSITNSKGPTFRKLGLKGKDLSDDELLEWLHKEQGMIKRPLIEKDGTYWVGEKGFDEEAILNFINN